MKKFLLPALILFFVALASVQLRPVQVFLMDLYLPAFPDWPAPRVNLGVADEGEIYFQTTSPYDLDVIFAGNTTARPTTGLGYLSYPERAAGREPVPAMILLPGSGGIAPGREHEYAELLNANGIAAFVVEYYESRGMTADYSYFMRTAAVTEFDLIADAHAALNLLATSPRIDKHRIGVMGFSYGGMASRLAMDARFGEVLSPELPGFALFVDVYGPCYQNLQSTKVNIKPLLTLRGTADASNDLPACTRREEELRALGVAVEAHIYEGAGHAWENFAERSMKEDAPYLAGCELTYDEAGHAYLDGKPMPVSRADASYAQRVWSRFTSATQYADCLGYGYIIGRDEATKQAADTHLLDFLGRHFALSRA